MILLHCYLVNCNFIAVGLVNCVRLNAKWTVASRKVNSFLGRGVPCVNPTAYCAVMFRCHVNGDEVYGCVVVLSSSDSRLSDALRVIHSAQHQVSHALTLINQF